MDSKQIINQRQLAWITSSVITSGGILTLQNVLIRISEMDAWFSYLLPVFYVFAISAFFGYLGKYFPGKHIFEISLLLLGRWAGSIVNLIVLFHFWMIVVRDITSLAKFSSTLLLHNTPMEILVLLPCLLLMYFGKSSVEVIARVNDLFYPLFVATVMLMPLLLSNEFYLRLVSPVLTAPIGHLTFNNMLTVGSAGDIFILGAFLHTMYNAKQIRASIRHGALLGIFLLTMIIFMILIVLGPKMPGNFMYPTYNLVQMIHVTDFLDRLDIVILTIWFPTIACKMIVIYTALLLGISSLLKDRNYPLINKPIALLLALTTIMSFRSTTELLSFANFSSPVIVLAYQPLVMILLLVRVMFAVRKNKLAQPSPPASDSASPVSNSASGSASWSQRLTGQQWLWLSNLLMLVSLGSVAVGLMFSNRFPPVGTICASCYGLCLTLTALTTYMEVSRLKQTQPGT